MDNDIALNLAQVLSRIEKTAVGCGRDPSEIKLVAVSKTHPPAIVRRAITAGVHAFGENKVQEAEAKIPEVGREAAEWHLIGHLQSNKSRKAVQLFDVIHSVDSPELAVRLERNCVEMGREALPVFVEVDLAGEETKSGVSEAELASLVETLHACERLKFQGLMIVPPYFEDPEDVRPYFRRLREIRDDILKSGSFTNGRCGLSMGMSHDFEIAIEEGATVVRIGTAIFGERERGISG